MLWIAEWWVLVVLIIPRIASQPHCQEKSSSSWGERWGKERDKSDCTLDRWRVESRPLVHSTTAGTPREVSIIRQAYGADLTGVANLVITCHLEGQARDKDERKFFRCF